MQQNSPFEGIDKFFLLPYFSWFNFLNSCGGKLVWMKWSWEKVTCSGKKKDGVWKYMHDASPTNNHLHMQSQNSERLTRAPYPTLISFFFFIRTFVFLCARARVFIKMYFFLTWMYIKAASIMLSTCNSKTYTTRKSKNIPSFV